MPTADAELSSTLSPDYNSSTRGRFEVHSAQATTGPVSPPVQYKLSAIRTGDGVRIYWSSGTVSFTEAPGGAGIYTAPTLVEEGSW